MANTFDPRSSDENDVYEYDNQSNDLVGKLGSAAIAVTSLVSAFAFLSPSAPATSTPAVNLSDSAPAEAGTTQATDPDVAAPTQTEAAAPATNASVNTAAAPASRPRVITSIHNAGPKAHGSVASNPTTSGTPSATPTVDPNASIGGVDVGTGNTTAPTSTTAAGGSTGGSTGNTTSPTSASSGGSTSSSTGGNTSSPTSAGSTASGTNGGGHHHEDDDDDH